MISKLMTNLHLAAYTAVAFIKHLCRFPWTSFFYLIFINNKKSEEIFAKVAEIQDCRKQLKCF